jgi:predicted CoA-substrate-specific enzyme activase
VKKLITLGVCIGSHSLSWTLFDHSNSAQNHIIQSGYLQHQGRPVECVRTIIDSIDNRYDLVNITGKNLTYAKEMNYIPEVEAVELACKFFKNKYADLDGIIDCGAETIFYYPLDSFGNIIDVIAGNKCASGTGEFLVQQIKRMGLGIEEANRIANLEDSYAVADRCSVFCKSDCTHALNKGVSKNRVIGGLLKMMANKALNLIDSCQDKKIMMIGGMSKNDKFIEAMRKSVKELVIADEATIFASVGAALSNSQNLSYKNDNFQRPDEDTIKYEPLHTANEVEFINWPEGSDTLIKSGNEMKFVLGIDIGSTTTKAVIVDIFSKNIIASNYLRTHGDPIAAIKKCLAAILDENPSIDHIQGIVTTGSGRVIASLYLNQCLNINEILAHAKAAVFFDKEVDTIFEIGGQDAKYTFLTAGVPSDYAMNEACSAGTGSFLEEAAKESLSIATEEIGDFAKRGDSPPHFNDQCAAFIGSDIKTAILSGISVENICAALVYSICNNYLTRVKGNRTVGKKIFMQGGVCFNSAVPIAMSKLLKKPVLVPPYPGLMGAYGASLIWIEKYQRGDIDNSLIDINALLNKKVNYLPSFLCRGGKERCDLKCQISLIEINDKKMAFGGACDKYNSKVEAKEKNSDRVDKLDLVSSYEKIMFNQSNIIPSQDKVIKKKIILTKSLMMNSFFPLFSVFFKELGLEVVLVEIADVHIDGDSASEFCYPVMHAHRLAIAATSREADYFFLPHIKNVQTFKGQTGTLCPFVQANPYMTDSILASLESKMQLLKPIINLTNDYADSRKSFLTLAQQLGFTHQLAIRAFDMAVVAQLESESKIKKLVSEAFKAMKDSNALGIVVFGRTYNAFASDLNMGITKKIACKGYYVFPCNYISEDYGNLTEREMYWASGQYIVEAAKYIAQDPNLFGVYITNFSCGPDSFLLNYFRNIMGGKPSLTIELDGHTSNAGVETRIEAFVDILENYRQIVNVGCESTQIIDQDFVDYPASKKLMGGKSWIIVPSMGGYSADLLAKGFEYLGYNSVPLPTPTAEHLRAGQSLTTCKECLPFSLVLGSILEYLRQNVLNDMYDYNIFLPTANGPCRFGQYTKLTRDVLIKEGYGNIRILSVSSEDSYNSFNRNFMLRSWLGLLTNDIMSDMKSALRVIAADTSPALETFETCVERIIEKFATANISEIFAEMRICAAIFSKIKKKYSLDTLPAVYIIGEIYVRRSDSCQSAVIERLIGQSIIPVIAPIHEWVYYCDYLEENSILKQISPIDKFKKKLEIVVKRFFEKRIKNIFDDCGLLREKRILDIKNIISKGARHLDLQLTGEAILTVGSGIEAQEDYQGVVSLYPFGCMPGRIAEFFLKNENKEHPFLSLELDGNILPPVIEAKLDSFITQVKRQK